MVLTVCYNICSYASDNVLTLAIIPGPKKPYDLMSFLKPIVDEITGLSRNGMVVKKNGETVYEGKVYLLGATGDIPGIADLMNHAGHMAYRGCRMCDTEGVRVQGAMCFPRTGGLLTMRDLIEGDEVRFYRKKRI
ncbi:hypothetical protein GCM10027060_21610 [Nesterenkonia halophila]